MRLLLSPGAFSGALSAVEAAAAVRSGWLRTSPDTEVTSLPMSDGAAGLLAVVHAARGGRLIPLTVDGPLGDPVPATVLHVPGAGGGTAYLEGGQVIGTQLTSPGSALDHARHGSSKGLGMLLDAALELGAGRIVVGLGAAACHDAGTGMLGELAGVASGPLDAGAGVASGTLDAGAPAGAPDQIDDVALARAHSRLAGRDVVIAVADQTPLLGLHGTGALLAEREGIDAAAAQEVDTRIGEIAARLDRLARRLPTPTSLLTPAPPSGPSRPGRADGSGAGGGVAFALGLLGGRLLPGPDVVADAVGLREAAGRADVVVTGTAVLDAPAVDASVVATVGRAAMEHGVPVVVLAEEVHTSRREVARSGLSATYETGDGGVDALETWGRRLARTWARTA